MSSYPILPSRPILPHIQSKCPKCSSTLEFPIPQPTPPFGTTLRVQCFLCQGTMNYTMRAPETGRTPTSPKDNSGPSLPRRSRKIGTQENPLETAYYETLGISVTATEEDIKKAYSTHTLYYNHTHTLSLNLIRLNNIQEDSL